jgi:hypothetical protein
MRLAAFRAELVLLFASLCVSFLGAELLVRTFLPSLPSSAVAISSSNYAVLDERGAVRHVPNEKVRMVSIVEDSLEFDVRFRTNSHGLVDHRNYPVSANSRRHYAFVGDSFTYGMGAEPWVPRLRDRVRERDAEVEIYNLGLNGASIQHFRALLSSIAQELPITHVVLIPISNDFYRPWWVPTSRPDGTYMCFEPRPDCTIVRPGFARIDYEADPHSIVKRFRDSKAAAVAQQPIDPWWKRALWKSRLYVVARSQVRLLIYGEPERDPADLEDPSRLGENMEALAAIRKEFHALPITLAHFPQMDEVRNGEYALDVAEAVSRIGIDYFPALTECSWSTDMYHPVNRHPNAYGYSSFAACLWDHLAAVHPSNPS